MKNPRILIFANVFDPSHDLMGFLPGWVAALQSAGAQVIVVTHGGRGSRAGRLWRVMRELVRRRREYDSLFVVMAPTWALLLSPLVRLIGKRAYLWYAVWRGSWKLRLATLAVTGILCSIPESFPFHSRKVRAVGQAIDVDRFTPVGAQRVPGQILCLGRISPVKRIDLLLEALTLMPGRRDSHSVLIAGAPVSESDCAYEHRLHQEVVRLQLAGVVVWRGKVPHDATHALYRYADIAVNMTPAGSFDKAMLEAMASGAILVASNPAVLRMLPSAVAATVGFKQDNATGLAAALVRVAGLADDEKDALRTVMRAAVVQHHSISQWAHNVLMVIG